MPFNKKLWRINIILIPLFLLLAILSIKITFVQIIEFKTMDIESDILNKVHPVDDTDIVIVDIDISDATEAFSMAKRLLCETCEKSEKSRS